MCKIHRSSLSFYNVLTFGLSLYGTSSTSATKDFCDKNQDSRPLPSKERYSVCYHRGPQWVSCCRRSVVEELRGGRTREPRCSSNRFVNFSLSGHTRTCGSGDDPGTLDPTDDGDGDSFPEPFPRSYSTTNDTVDTGEDGRRDALLHFARGLDREAPGTYGSVSGGRGRKGTDEDPLFRGGLWVHLSRPTDSFHAGLSPYDSPTPVLP